MVEWIDVGVERSIAAV